MNHKGGWDRLKTFDPIFSRNSIPKFHDVKFEDLTKEHVVSYMMTRPLEYEPGEKFAYSNFGYMLLGMVIEKVTDKSYEENVNELAGKLKATFRFSSMDMENRHESEVFYPRESGFAFRRADSIGGLTSNAESLCKFMKKYWSTGVRRKKKDKKKQSHTGRLPKSTSAQIVYRKDGVDFVLLFNATRDKGYAENLHAIRDAINETVEEIKKSK
jgi:N-acyl-D-amino-acid deacylase